jgi:hypothetical protein
MLIMFYHVSGNRRTAMTDDNQLTDQPQGQDNEVQMVEDIPSPEDEALLDRAWDKVAALNLRPDYALLDRVAASYASKKEGKA